jgi:hypothetical protein
MMLSTAIATAAKTTATVRRVDARLPLAHIALPGIAVEDEFESSL